MSLRMLSLHVFLKFIVTSHNFAFAIRDRAFERHLNSISMALMHRVQVFHQFQSLRLLVAGVLWTLTTIPSQAFGDLGRFRSVFGHNKNFSLNRGTVSRVFRSRYCCNCSRAQQGRLRTTCCGPGLVQRLRVESFANAEMQLQEDGMKGRMSIKVGDYIELYSHYVNNT